MDLEKTKKLKQLLEENFPNRKYWIVDNSSMTEAEIIETFKEIEEFKRKQLEEQEIFRKALLN